MTAYSAQAAKVMAFEGAELDATSIGPGLEDAKAFALLEQRLIVGGRRARLVDDAVIQWRRRDETHARWRKLVRFSDGRGLQDYEAAARPFRSLIEEMQRWRRARRATERRGHSGMTAWSRPSSCILPPRDHALATSLEPVIKRIDAYRKAAWLRCLADGRILRSVGDALSAAMVAPGEAAPRALAKTARYLFLS